jgi:hypothetical protein
VRNQIDGISDALERHKTQLLTDIASLDRLYTANLDYFHTLELYIQAGEEKLRQVDTEELPALEREVADQRGYGQGPAIARLARQPRRSGAAGSRPQADPAGHHAKLCPASDWCKRTTRA